MALLPIEACNRYDLRDVEVVLDFGDPSGRTEEVVEALAVPVSATVPDSAFL